MANETEYKNLLEFLKTNEEKLKVFLTAEEKMKDYRYKLRGKKKSRTIFMSVPLQFLMQEYCIENDLRIGDFVELAIIEHLNRHGKAERLLEIIENPSLASSDEGKQGKKQKVDCQTTKSGGEV
ncbi:MAG: hypothetical protein IJO83_07625 [Clostridia bacterium]|nr:hypothetical protein [Clostridia bacterium]